MPPVSRRFGPYDVSICVDGVYQAPTEILVHHAGTEARELALQGWGRDEVKLDVNCFILRGPDGISLIDSGAGVDWGPAFGHARETMRSDGVAPGDVRRVLLTHIHGDHALGLFAVEDAYFPNAEIWVPEPDFAFFTDPAAREITPERRRGGFAIAERLLRVYGERMKRIADGPVLPGVEAVPLPGHSPGHTGYRILGDDGTLLIWGDALHVGDLQPGDPEIGVVFDSDPAMAVATRRAALARAADDGWVVAGGHIAGFNRVSRADAAFALSPA